MEISMTGSSLAREFESSIETHDVIKLHRSCVGISTDRKETGRVKRADYRMLFTLSFRGFARRTLTTE
jgi:hypothetical protein